MGRLNFYTTETNYNTSKNSFDYPTVAYVEETEEVKWMSIQDKYKNEYLTFTALEDGTFTLTVPANVDSTYMTSISYSVDNGANWTTTTIDNTAQTITTPTINAGDKVLWKGEGSRMTYDINNDSSSHFSSTGNFNVSGNIMSILYGDSFRNKTSFASGSSCMFGFLFSNCSMLINAENLILPATTLTTYCYSDMFQGCTALTTAPELPATTLAQRCYYNMFNGCTSLTTAPVLPATTLAQLCYGAMFEDCTSLTTAPELPATTLADRCYQVMFSGCTSLTTAPVLPATTLVSNCYIYMFDGCTALNNIKAMFTTTPSREYLGFWVRNVAATGTFIKNSTVQWNVTATSSNNYSGVPSGWTVQTASE